MQGHQQTGRKRLTGPFRLRSYGFLTQILMSDLYGSRMNTRNV
jgi:hypothetical protein